MTEDTPIRGAGSRTFTGIVLGILAAVSYGTNPLFAVPLYQAGYSVGSVLFYRYALATLILGVIMAAKCAGSGQRWYGAFRLNPGECVAMAVMGVLFALSSILLFEAYRYMDVGLASTLLFMEPVSIALILWIVYREKMPPRVILSIAVCVCGVVCIGNPGAGAHVTATGVVLVILSAVAYGIYMVAINKSRVRRLDGMRITFYSLLFGQIVFAVTTRGYTQVQGIDTADTISCLCLLGIAVVPTIISLLTVAVSVKYVGSLTVAILGALEPVTGLMVGVLLFGEVLTPVAVLGIVLILTSVMVIILARARSHQT